MKPSFFGPASLMILLAAALVLVPDGARAQRGLGERETDWTRGRLSGGVALLNTQPLGELRTGPGVGVAAHGALALVPGGALRLRGEFRGATYGHDEQEFCLSQPIGCWIEMRVNTDYTMLYGGVGPELAIRVPGGELALSATAGVGNFAVGSSLEGVDGNGEGFGRTTHYSDTFFAWSGGGELRIPVSRMVAVSLGTHYQHDGRVSYVLDGSITQRPDGTLDVRPVTTDANLVAITLGVAIRR